MSLPNFNGIHHLKFPVSNLDRSIDFYRRAIGAKRIDALDHIDGAGRLYAVILDVPNLGTKLELRLDPTAAAQLSGFNPITLGVESRADLENWMAHFDAGDVPHSPILPASVAWLVVFEDPDGLRLRLYTNELHSADIAPTNDQRWL